MRQLIIAVAVALLAIVFALQNDILITVRLIFWELPHANLALVLVLTLMMGLVIGLLFMAPGIYRRNQVIATQKKRLLEFESKYPSGKPSL